MRQVRIEDRDLERTPIGWRVMVSSGVYVKHGHDDWTEARAEPGMIVGWSSDGRQGCIEVLTASGRSLSFSEFAIGGPGCILVDEPVWDRRWGGAYDRGGADSFYHRPPVPHCYEGNTLTTRRVCRDEMSDMDVMAYFAGYHANERQGDFKEL